VMELALYWSGRHGVLNISKTMPTSGITAPVVLWKMYCFSW